MHDIEENKNVETYVMRSTDLFQPAVNDAIEETDRTIIVKRMDLTFNEIECQVLNFTDITAYKRLKQEEEKNRLLKVVNT